MPRAAQTPAWGRGSGWITSLVVVLGLAAAFIVTSAQPGGEIAPPDGAEVLGIQLERADLPAAVAVPAVTTTPPAAAGPEPAALPGGGGAASRSVDRDWATGLTLLVLGLAGLGLVAASSPHRRRTALGPPV